MNALTDLQRTILRHVAQANGVGLAARANGILDATDDDPQTILTLEDMSARGWLRMHGMSLVARPNQAGWWLTDEGQKVFEGDGNAE